MPSLIEPLWLSYVAGVVLLVAYLVLTAPARRAARRQRKAAGQ